MTYELKARLRFAAIAVVLVLVALLAVSGSDHVDAHADPSRPIVGLDLHVYKYPDFQTTRIACDGTAVYPFPNARIEPIVFLDNAPEWRGVNSEHWSVRLEVFGTVNVNGQDRQRRLWDTLWQNQNTPDGGRFGKMEVVQSNSYGFNNGPAKIQVKVVGSVTGNTFVIDCPFTVAVP